MSVSIELEELQERLSEYGPIALLITVGDGRGPHVVSVRVEYQDGALVAGAGRTTAANVTASPAVTAVWPAVGGGDYCLIVDGAGRIEGSGDGQQGPSGPLSGKQGPSGPLSGKQGPSGPLSGKQGPSGPLSGKQVRIEPSRAVLHRVASAEGDGPSCITVLDQRDPAGR